MRIPKAKRDKLLSRLRAGHDLEAAAGDAGLSVEQIEFLQIKHDGEIAQAFRTGTARLRSKIMDSALASDDSAVLLKMLEHREAVQTVDNEITQIDRVITHAVCPHCGKPAFIRSATPDKSDSQPVETQREEKPTEPQRTSYLGRKWDSDRKCFVSP